MVNNDIVKTLAGSLINPDVLNYLVNLNIYIECLHAHLRAGQTSIVRSVTGRFNTWDHGAKREVTGSFKTWDPVPKKDDDRDCSSALRNDLCTSIPACDQPPLKRQ